MKNQLILEAYLEALLWTNEYDDKTIFNFSKKAVKQSENDILSFLHKVELNDTACEELSTLSESEIGHNFLLSRNRHGAGFFDDYNDELQKLSNEFPEVNIYKNRKVIEIF